MPPSASRSGRQRSLTSIAATAGVSVSTVSKVLNGRTDVSPETRDRLTRVLRSHGYRVAQRSTLGVVDLLIGPLDSPWSEELIRGAITAAAEASLSVIVTRVASAEDFAHWLAIALRRGTDGALSVLHLPGATERRRLAGAHIPLVIVDPPTEPGGDIRSVGTTNWRGGLTATRHLIELGHRRIGAVGGPADLWSCRARLDGYRSALLHASLPVDETLVCRDRLSASGGLRQTRHLLSLAVPPTAIVAGNDAQAFGVLQALGEHGLRAPGDVSVIGFDDLPIAAWATPPLTTIRQPLAAMAATALRMLHTTEADSAVQVNHVELDTTLVVRESTGPPRPATAP